MIDFILLLGLLFAVAVLFGGLSNVLHLPRVVGYLVGGLALMISVRWVLPGLALTTAYTAAELQRLVEDLNPIKEIALGFIMFDIGARFELSSLRRALRRMYPVALAEMGATCLAVTGGLMLVGASWQVSLLLGVMAIATAPVTTIMVLRQYESEGPLTEHLHTLLAFNNTVSILLFGMAFLIVELSAGHGDMHQVVTRMPWDLAGSLGIGLGAGVLVSYFYERVAARTRSTLLIAILVCAIGLSRTFDVPYMLSLLVLGMMMANTSEYQREIRGILDGVAAPLYVLFFMAAGAGLHLDALATIGAVGTAYVLLRTVGKLGGAWLGARWAGSPGVVRRLSGMALLSQAGAAIGLGILASQRDPELGHQLLSVILASVVIFEILGPVLLKTSLVRAGEVKVINFLEHSPKPGYLSSVRTLLRRLGDSLGFGGASGRALESLRVRDVMVTNVRTLQQAATYAEIIDFLEHCRHTVFPVVDADERYLGYIPYRVVQELMVDPALGRLLIAKDLMETGDIQVYAGDDLETALARFNETDQAALPVMDPEQEGLLVGIIEQREVLRLLRKQLKGADEDSTAA